ncbi:hypothetical protein JNK13_11055 [bacterium]|nr:hypothetical protein [bacterium]
MIKNKLFLLLSILFCTISCSTVFESEASSAVKLTIMNVTNEYIRAIAAGNENAVESLVLWAEYADQAESNFTKALALEEVRSLSTKFQTPEGHPLIGLEVLDLSSRGNHASISLRNPALPSMEQIKIHLLWTGSAWNISHDNLFGKDRIIEKLIQQS